MVFLEADKTASLCSSRPRVAKTWLVEERECGCDTDVQAGLFTHVCLRLLTVPIRDRGG